MDRTSLLGKAFPPTGAPPIFTRGTNSNDGRATGILSPWRSSVAGATTDGSGPFRAMDPAPIPVSGCLARSRGAGRRRYSSVGRGRYGGAGHGSYRNARPTSLPCRCYDAGRKKWDGIDCSEGLRLSLLSHSTRSHFPLPPAQNAGSSERGGGRLAAIQTSDGTSRLGRIVHSNRRAPNLYAR